MVYKQQDQDVCLAAIFTTVTPPTQTRSALSCLVVLMTAQDVNSNLG